LAYRHLLGIGVIALGLVNALPSHAAAQSTTTLAPTAATLPRGVLGVRVLTAWTRWDALYGFPTVPLGDRLSVDTVGPAQLPLFAPNEAAIQAASGVNSFRLTAGRLVASANSRVATSPLIVEYGVTSRLTVGLVVPLVQTRTNLVAAMNPQLGFANVGPNPSQLDAATAAGNAATVGQFSTAASTLNARLTSCQQNPAQPQCAPIVGHEADARALIQTANTFAATLASLYGTGGNQPGQLYVPLAATPIQQTISARIARFDTLYRAFLGAPAISGGVAAAQAPAALLQLQQLMLIAGHDTLQSPDRISIGDITVGAVFQLLNTYGDSMAASAVRASVNGSVRIGTGQPAARNKYFDIGTGYGQAGLEGGAAIDLRYRGRWSATALASYTHQMGTVTVDRVPDPIDAPFPLSGPVSGDYSAGDVLSFTVLPRYRLARFFGLHGSYSLLHVGADRYTNFAAADAELAPGVPGLAAATAQSVGFGFSYSTATEPDRAPGRLPVEVRYSHSETIGGSGGPIPKAFRDQIELKVYFGKRR
jgi:hypothetical protein